MSMQVFEKPVLRRSVQYSIQRNLILKNQRIRGICGICLETIPENAKEVCGFCSIECCTDCYRSYISSKVNDGIVSSMALICFGEKCRLPISKLDIERVLQPEMLQKYIHFKNVLRPGQRYCPKVDCGKVIKEALYSKNRDIYCQDCQVTYCVLCSEEYHGHGDCSNVDVVLYQHWKRKSNTVRTCPKCSWDIEKIGGCTHMRCGRCRFEFCWLCMTPWFEHSRGLCKPKQDILSSNTCYGPSIYLRTITKSFTCIVLCLYHLVSKINLHESKNE